MTEKLVGPTWLDQNETAEAYINKVEKALSLAWKVIDQCAIGRTIKEPGMSVQARPMSKSEIQLLLSDVMKQIEELK